MSEKEKVFITPDDWALPDSERMMVTLDTSEVLPPGCVMIERDDSELPYTMDWYIISIADGDVMRLHKDEIKALYEFAFGENENVEKLVNAAKWAEVLMDALALLGIGDCLPPQYKEDWPTIHTGLQEALSLFGEDGDGD